MVHKTLTLHFLREGREKITVSLFHLIKGSGWSGNQTSPAENRADTLYTSQQAFLKNHKFRAHNV